LFCNNSCSKRLLIIVWLLDHFWYNSILKINRHVIVVWWCFIP
jgi:hypothetical protein